MFNFLKKKTDNTHDSKHDEKKHTNKQNKQISNEQNKCKFGKMVKLPLESSVMPIEVTYIKQDDIIQKLYYYVDSGLLNDDYDIVSTKTYGGDIGAEQFHPKIIVSELCKVIIPWKYANKFEYNNDKKQALKNGGKYDGKYSDIDKTKQPLETDCYFMYFTSGSNVIESNVYAIFPERGILIEGNESNQIIANSNRNNRFFIYANVDSIIDFIAKNENKLSSDGKEFSLQLKFPEHFFSQNCLDECADIVYFLLKRTIEEFDGKDGFNITNIYQSSNSIAIFSDKNIDGNIIFDKLTNFFKCFIKDVQNIDLKTKYIIGKWGSYIDFYSPLTFSFDDESKKAMGIKIEINENIFDNGKMAGLLSVDTKIYELNDTIAFWRFI